MFALLFTVIIKIKTKCPETNQENIRLVGLCSACGSMFKLYFFQQALQERSC